MKSLLFSLVFIFSATLFAQQDSEEVKYNAVLTQGETLAIGGKTIKFSRVISDSRCPREVTCIWAGEAKVLISVYENGKFLEEQIISTSSEFTHLNFLLGDLAYEITSLLVLPYPTTSQKNNTNTKYSIQLEVTGN